MSLKRIEIGLRTAPSEYAVTPDEMDRYEVYTAANVSPDTAWYFLGTAGTSKVQPGTWLTVLPDYPRNIQFSITGTGVGMQGTAIINGVNQFGKSITETYSFGSSDTGGAVVGTQIFAQITSGTFYYGTAVGAGTLRLGFGTGGTTCMFGLPTKVGGTADLLLYSWGSASTPVKVGAGTLGGWVDTTYHAIKAASDIAGSTTHFSVWYKPSFNGEGTQIAALAQRV
jgi:hypothetical protein